MDRQNQPRRPMSRRSFMALAAAAAMDLALPRFGWTSQDRGELSFVHTHTGERLRIPYQGSSVRDPRVMKAVNTFLRDFRTGEVHPIDPGLLDILFRIRQDLGGSTFAVISGYRSPKTNAMLRRQGHGVARRSLHMKGRAIDIRLHGVETRLIRKCAMSMRCGGVGYYAQSDFVHLDTGRVRFW